MTTLKNSLISNETNILFSLLLSYFKTDSWDSSLIHRSTHSLQTLFRLLLLLISFFTCPHSFHPQSHHSLSPYHLCPNVFYSVSSFHPVTLRNFTLQMGRNRYHILTTHHLPHLPQSCILSSFFRQTSPLLIFPFKSSIPLKKRHPQPSIEKVISRRPKLFDPRTWRNRSQWTHVLVSPSFALTFLFLALRSRDFLEMKKETGVKKESMHVKEVNERVWFKLKGKMNPWKNEKWISKRKQKGNVTQSSYE